MTAVADDARLTERQRNHLAELAAMLAPKNINLAISEDAAKVIFTGTRGPICSSPLSDFEY